MIKKEEMETIAEKVYKSSVIKKITFDNEMLESAKNLFYLPMETKVKKIGLAWVLGTFGMVDLK